MSDWILLLYLILSISTLYDVIEYRIPNYCIVAGLIGGLWLQVAIHGVSGICLWFIGLAVPFAVLVVLYLLRVIGAGDVKLFMVIGGFLGVGPMPSILCYSCLAGAVLALAKMLKERNLFSRLQLLATYLATNLLQKSIQPYPVADPQDKKAVIPFSVAIMTGTLLWNGIIFYK